MCIIWTDEKLWCEVSLLFDQPEMIFAIPIEVATDDGEMEDSVFGRYPMPLSYDIILPELSDGASCDLIDFCICLGRGRPDYFTSVQKLDAVSTTGGWNVCLLHHIVVVPKNKVDVKSFIEKGANEPIENRQKITITWTEEKARRYRFRPWLSLR